jgi:CRP-like cAMP-binding protein
MMIENWAPPGIIAASTVRAFRAGAYLFRQGSRVLNICEVVSGSVRLVRVGRTGHEGVLFIARAGDIAGDAALFSSIYHCDAIVAAKASVRLYPKDVLLAEFRCNPDFAEAYATMLARQVMTLRTRLERRNIHSARDRVRHFLALNVSDDGSTVELPGTLREFASELGLTHEVLYRTLAAMAAEGEIDRSGRVIKLLRDI